MNRGFVVLFVPFGADISSPANHQMVASIGNSEEEVATSFAATYVGERQLIGILSLEEIEEHHRLILDHAAEQGVELDRCPLAERNA